MDFLQSWFNGFNKGLDDMDDGARSSLLRECAQCCADTGIKDVYLQRLKDAGGDLDRFFAELSGTQFTSGRVVEPGRVYDMMFPECLCDLYTKGYVSTGALCECSRRSISYIMAALAPGREATVEQLSTVLCGDESCRFRITLG